MDEQSDDEISNQESMMEAPGELLARAREEKGLSRINVSELLGLTETAIRDIELGRFEKFPSGIYVRGYLRNYSKLVDADEELILEAYDHYGKSHEIPEASPFGSLMPADNMPKSPLSPKIVIGMLVVLIIAAIIFVS